MNSYNLRKFKKEVGQANHFLITILIGLDGIAQGKVEKNAEFSTTWNPKNKEVSAIRSREFALRSALTWVVDNLHMYLRMANEKPKLIPVELQQDFDENGRSVYKAFQTVQKHYELDKVRSSLIDLMICWRNRLVHYKADNEPDREVFELLDKSKEEIFEDYCGLDINQAISRFKKKEPPRFKEVTSMIKATIGFAYELDGIFIRDLGLVEYYDKVLIYYFGENEEYLKNVFGNSKDKMSKKLKEILRTFGCDEINDNVEKYIKEIVNCDYKTARNKIENEGTFL